MLARGVARSLRSPICRQLAVTSLRVSSTQWSRTMASNNRRGFGKKPVDYSGSSEVPHSYRPSSIGPQRTTERPTVETQPPSSASTPDEVPNPEYSTPRNGSAESVQTERSTVSKSGRSWPGSPPPIRPKTEPNLKEEQESESKQENFDGRPLASETSSQASPLTDPSETPTESQPLPDLTQGIPSTLEFETMGTSSKASAGTALNLTEDPSQEPSPGGRGRGELPASAYISSSEKKRLRFANYMYASFVALLAGAYIYLGRNWESEEEEREHPNAPSGWAVGLMWNRVRARMGDQLNYYNEPAFRKLLPDVDPSFERPYTLCLSLEDLLVHSEWSREHGWRMAKRPGVDYFLRYLSQYYELVLFTSVSWANGEPVLRKLDPYHIITWPLYREATRYKDGEYIKDLSYLNRDLSKVMLIDTVAAHAKAQPTNAIILPKWKGDPKDTELISLIPFLEYIATMGVPDVRAAVTSFAGTHIPTEFALREAVARKKFEAEVAAERSRRPKSGLGFISSALGVKPMIAVEGESPAEAFAKGKMLQDQARERGQKNYEALEKMIREEGEKWLKEEAVMEEAAKAEGLKAMKSGFTGFFGSSPKKDS